jgi:hypothetical protein
MSSSTPAWGEAHRLTIEFDAFTASWKARAAQFEAQLVHHPLTPLYVVQWVQLRLNMWFQDQGRLSVQVSPLDLQELFQDFRLDNPWHPRMIRFGPLLKGSIPAPIVAIRIPGVPQIWSILCWPH